MTKEKPGILQQYRPLFPKCFSSGFTVEIWDTVKSYTLKYLQCNRPFFIAKKQGHDDKREDWNSLAVLTFISKIPFLVFSIQKKKRKIPVK